jgi:hypothetical protein
MTAVSLGLKWQNCMHRNCTTLCITRRTPTSQRPAGDLELAKACTGLCTCILRMIWIALYEATLHLALVGCQLEIIELQPNGHKTNTVITPSFGNPRLPAVFCVVGVFDRDFRASSCLHSRICSLLHRPVAFASSHQARNLTSKTHPCRPSADHL